MREQISKTRNALLEAEAQITQALALARHCVTLAEAALSEARAETEKCGLEFFSEQDFAARLGVSEDTIRRMRRRGFLKPLRIGSLVRYSSNDLRVADEVFRASRFEEHRGKRRA